MPNGPLIRKDHLFAGIPKLGEQGDILAANEVPKEDWKITKLETTELSSGLHKTMLEVTSTDGKNTILKADGIGDTQAAATQNAYDMLTMGENGVNPYGAK